jgi:hypothetical protein
MKRNILSDKLDELYRKENIYVNPIQTRPKPKAGISGEKPDDEDLGVTYTGSILDDDEVTKDLGLKGNEKDLGLKGNEKDIGSDKKSEPKDWKFKGPRDEIHQED